MNTTHKYVYFDEYKRHGGLQKGNYRNLLVKEVDWVFLY